MTSHQRKIHQATQTAELRHTETIPRPHCKGETLRFEGDGLRYVTVTFDGKGYIVGAAGRRPNGEVWFCKGNYRPKFILEEAVSVIEGYAS